MASSTNDENRITYFAETDARNRRLKFGIKAKDRTRHVYVIGKTGMGKSTLLENMAVQDIQGGEGMAFIDPHGKTADLLLEYVPKERIRDVIYIAPFDVEHPISFNVLESVDPAKRHLVTSGLMSTFKKIWEDAWSARMEYILTNTLLALLEAPGTTLLGVNRMLSDKDYRKEIVSHVKDPSVSAFWNKEFANYTERQAAEAVPAIQNKVGQFTANPLIRNMIGQPVSSFDFREAMDQKKIIIINLSKGRIGDENMKLLGGLLVTKIYLAAMSRADVPDRVMKNLPNFYLFVDEFQNFANASFADILSEARKYKLNLTIAHQYVEQMDEVVRPAVFGNVGTMIAFRVGATDAEAFEQEFAPVFVIEDLVNLGFAQVYMKLMIDGLSSTPFSATTLPPIAHPEVSYVDEIIAASREQFTRPRAEVEESVIKFHEPTPKAPPAPKVAAASAPKAAAASSASTPISPAVSAVKTSTTAPIVSPKPVAVTSAPVAAVAPVRAPITAPVVSTKPETISPAAPMNNNAPVKAVVTPTPQTITHAVKTETKVPQPIKQPVEKTPELSKTNHHVNGHQDHAPVKSMPLSALSNPPKAVHKTDPKLRSPENMNDLRNALAAVLGNKKAPEKSTDSVQAKSIEKAVETKITPSTTKTPDSSSSVSHKSDEHSPKEVPEDILRNILKVD